MRKINAYTYYCKLYRSKTIMMAKLPAVKSLLLRAWRERWSDMQWSVNVKRLVNLANTEETNELAELLLDQALVGSTPNMLILSYLRHAISTQMITFDAAVRNVIKFKDLSKLYCVKSLMDIMEVFADKISARGAHEDAHSISRSLLSLLAWLLDIAQQCLGKLKEGQLQAEHTAVLEKCCDILEKLLTNRTTTALLYIARLEDPNLFARIEESEGQAHSVMNSLQNTQLPASLLTRLQQQLKLLANIQDCPMEPSLLLDVSHQSLNISLNVLICTEAVLNPTSDIQPLVEQILIIRNLQGLTMPNLYSEILRSCMMGMVDTAGGPDELKWAAFMYLKLPQILLKLVKHSPESFKARHLEQGLERLLNYVPLLDLADAKCHCDCLHYLLHELWNKCSLVTEDQCRKYLAKRQSEGQRPRTPEATGQQPCAGLILRAEPTVSSILKSLDADYSKNQEALLGILHRMMSGKSFELILAAAAATGKLQTFAIKLVKFNEFAKQTAGEAGKAAQTRAMIFDISFLMLCHIVQQYGIETVTSSAESSASFFAQWATHCLPEGGKYKSLDLFPPHDKQKVELLLGQFNPGCELRTSLSRWHEICQNTPYVIQEVLSAWEHGALKQDNVQKIVDNMKSRMCCLPVAVAAWLCSYINVMDERARRRPLSLLKLLNAPAPPPAAADTPVQYHAEKSNLMQLIMRRMVQDLLPSTSPPEKYGPSSLPPNTPARTVLIDTFKKIFQRGCIDIQSIHQMETLLTLGGTQWFCENLVKDVLSQERLEDLNRGIALLFSLFHMDLENLTLSLLHHVVPRLLQQPTDRLTLLLNPKGQVLARLCLMCLCVLHKMKELQKASGSSPLKKGRKRTRTDIELDEPDELEERASKLRRMSTYEDMLPFSMDSTFNVSDLTSSQDDMKDDLPSYDTKEPINRALVNLFRLFNAIVSQPAVSPRTGFVVAFIEAAVNCGQDAARFVFQFMPVNMVSQLIKCLPLEFKDAEVILHMCDLTSSLGRKVAAKVICQHAKCIKVTEAMTCVSAAKPSPTDPGPAPVLKT